MEAEGRCAASHLDVIPGLSSPSPSPLADRGSGQEFLSCFRPPKLIEQTKRLPPAPNAVPYLSTCGLHYHAYPRPPCDLSWHLTYDEAHPTDQWKLEIAKKQQHSSKMVHQKANCRCSPPVGRWLAIPTKWHHLGATWRMQSSRGCTPVAHPAAVYTPNTGTGSYQASLRAQVVRMARSMRSRSTL